MKLCSSFTAKETRAQWYEITCPQPKASQQACSRAVLNAHVLCHVSTQAVNLHPEMRFLTPLGVSLAVRSSIHHILYLSYCKWSRRWKEVAMVWLFTSHQNFSVENLMPKGDGIRRWLGNGDKALMNGINTLTKGALMNSLTASTVWGYRNLQPGRRPSPDHAGALMLDSRLASRAVRNKFLWFINYPVWRVLWYYRKKTGFCG